MQKDVLPSMGTWNSPLVLTARIRETERNEGRERLHFY